MAAGRFMAAGRTIRRSPALGAVSAAAAAAVVAAAAAAARLVAYQVSR